MSKLIHGILKVDELDRIDPCLHYGTRAYVIYVAEHWLLLVFYASSHILYFDPLGQKPEHYSVKLSNWLKTSKCPVKMKLVQLQPYDSNTCGLYILYFVYFLSRGVPFNSIMKKFHKHGDLGPNDIIVSKFVLKQFNFQIKV